ncbi:hypothetical protein B9Z55_000003 [Caenorhabditis nigoni]|uniref:Uncharacterized protein n=1 Tax=Caenorhabditis nigoni TaxID=1611254 RepID=A0A2G5VN46_9PELO|nr:hypothetical protein B9Z55_000003 [Caenorhabditis nigoni]
MPSSILQMEFKSLSRDFSQFFQIPDAPTAPSQRAAHPIDSSQLPVAQEQLPTVLLPLQASGEAQRGHGREADGDPRRPADADAKDSTRAEVPGIRDEARGLEEDLVPIVGFNC